MLLALNAGQAIITTCMIPDDADLDALLGCLAPDIAGRASKRKQAADRLSHAAAYLLLRQCLAPFTGGSAVALQKDVFGKPILVQPLGDPPIQFSISHTRGAVAVALARGPAIGVDVEPIVQPLRRKRIIEALSPTERRALSELDGNDQLTALISIWTLKEAVIKADGRGLAMPLDSFSVDHRTATFREPSDAPNPSPGWLLEQRHIAGYLVAAALRSEAISEKILWKDISYEQLIS